MKDVTKNLAVFEHALKTLSEQNVEITAFDKKASEEISDHLIELNRILSDLEVENQSGDTRDIT